MIKFAHFAIFHKFSAATARYRCYLAE